MKILIAEGSPRYQELAQPFVDAIDFAAKNCEKVRDGCTSGIREVRLCPSPPTTSKVVLSEDGQVIHVFPENFLAGDRPDILFYQAVGKRLYNRMSKESKAVWSSLLFRVTAEIKDRVCEAFSPEKSFQDSLQTLTDAVDRLIFIHCANALRNSSVTPSQLQQLSVGGLHCCQGMLGGQIPVSLIPLVSVYGDSDLTDFCQYFARVIVAEGKVELPESSTANCLYAIFRAVT